MIRLIGENILLEYMTSRIFSLFFYAQRCTDEIVAYAESRRKDFPCLLWHMIF